MTEQAQWYVKRGKQTRGPFTTTMLKKVASSGRLRETDQLSKDQINWKVAKNYPKLFAQTTGNLLLKDDERNGYDRRQKNADAKQTSNTDDQHNENGEHRAGPERRQPETKQEIERRKRRTNLLESIREHRPEDRFPYAAIVVTILLIAIAGFWMHTPEEVSVADCAAIPAPKINWDNCQLDKVRVVKADMSESSMRSATLRAADLRGTRLTASSLAYADLSGAKLSEANFDLADMKGANLRGSDLSGTSFVSADLSYADLRESIFDDTDLTGAILDNAIMPSGKVCARGSIGECL